MPDLAQWALLLAIGLPLAGAIAWPLLRPRPSATSGAQPEAEAEARALRHRVALDALLDVEADRRAGSLDDASYERERAAAEARAVETLESQPSPTSAMPAGAPRRGLVVVLGALVAVVLLVGFGLPGSIGLGQRTVVNQALAAELQQEADRQAEIQRLLGLFETNPQDAQVVSDLADAYLAGGSPEDLQRAAVALQILLALEPEDETAYRRLINAYIVTGYYDDAQATTDAYATIAAPDEPDIPFYRGLIAFRTGDNETAVREFDRFLDLAPDDDRASMVSGLRAEAAGALPGS